MPAAGHLFSDGRNERHTADSPAGCPGARRPDTDRATRTEPEPAGGSPQRSAMQWGRDGWIAKTIVHAIPAALRDGTVLAEPKLALFRGLHPLSP